MTTAERTITEETARFIIDTSYNDLPEALRAEARRCILDGLAVMLAGTTEDCTKIIHKYIGGLGVAGPARVPGTAASFPAEFAALASGVSGHAHDFDDTQIASAPNRVYGLLTHPTVPALSAALAVAQEVDASGKDLVTAFCIGLEVECKLNEAINPRHYQQGFHSTGTFGVFASVAAAAKLLGLDLDTTRTAISIAASKSAGIRCNFGTMTKPYHSGAAAQNGIVAARLASMGYEADPSGLDGPWGYFAVAGGGVDEEYVRGKLGNPWALLDPGVSVKPYPCGSLLHPTMDALRELVIAHDVAPENIEEVRLGTASNVINALRYVAPKNALQAKFSIQFMLGVLALRRRAGIAEFRDEVVSSPDVQAMMQRVKPYLDPEIDAQGFERIRSRVEVMLKDGTTLTQEASVSRGTPERPMTPDELAEKFTECATGVISADAIAKAIEAVRNVESLSNVSELLTALG
jgi:2-methylcitrate dehydratase PrpD